MSNVVRWSISKFWGAQFHGALIERAGAAAVGTIPREVREDLDPASQQRLGAAKALDVGEMDEYGKASLTRNPPT